MGIGKQEVEVEMNRYICREDLTTGSEKTTASRLAVNKLSSFVPEFVKLPTNVARSLQARRFGKGDPAIGPSIRIQKARWMVGSDGFRLVALPVPVLLPACIEQSASRSEDKSRRSSGCKSKDRRARIQDVRSGFRARDHRCCPWSCKRVLRHEPAHRYLHVVITVRTCFR